MASATASAAFGCSTPQTIVRAMVSLGTATAPAPTCGGSYVFSTVPRPGHAAAKSRVHRLGGPVVAGEAAGDCARLAEHVDAAGERLADA